MTDLDVDSATTRTHRKCGITPGMRKIELTQGQVALVDDQDYEALARYSWSAAREGNTFYARTMWTKPDGKKTSKKMHRLIGEAMGIACPIDHIDRNGLNNQRSNLRPGPPKLNHANEGKMQTRKTASRFKGVAIDRRDGRWYAHIMINRKGIGLGRFLTEEEAAHAYDRAALAAWGEYANPNFPRETYANEVPQNDLRKRPTYGGKRTTSRYRGVYAHQGKWVANAPKTGKYIGIFMNEEDAARAHDDEARKILGEKARLNFPNE